MTPKKSEKANLEKSRIIFLQIGLVITLSFLIFAFEWKSERQIHDLGTLTTGIVEEEFIPITRTEEVKPPQPKPPTVTEVINIVDDDIDIEDELEIETTEATESTEIVVQELKEEDDTEDTPFVIVEDMPIFKKGTVTSYIADNIKYPPLCIENNIQGRVFVQYVVNEKGKVTDVKIMRGVDPLLDKEAKRVVEGMPDYIPGKQRGKCVKVSFVVPVNFVLAN